MRSRNIALGGVVLLLAGCAHKAPKFAGRAPVESGFHADILFRSVSPGTADYRWIRNYATVRAVRGPAYTSNDNGTSWKKGRVGAHLQAGVTIRTGPASKGNADLFLGENGPVIRLLGDSTIRIVRLDLARPSENERVIDTRIDLLNGKILGNVKKLHAASTYLIRTRKGLIKVHGSEFTATADGELNVVSGRAEIILEGQSLALESGQSYAPGRGIEQISPLALEEFRKVGITGLELGMAPKG